MEAGDKIELEGVNLSLTYLRSDSHPDSKVGKTARTIHISNFDYGTREEDLKAKFEEYGEIDRIHIPRHPDGNSKGFAFITYKDKESSTEAIRLASGQEFLGRPIYVNPSKPPQRRRKENDYDF